LAGEKLDFSGFSAYNPFVTDGNKAKLFHFFTTMEGD
jgi:hypothetical protein